MSDFWWRPLAAIGLSALFALVLWPFAGGAAAAVVFAILLLLYLVHHLRNLKALGDWLRAPDAPVPEGSGIWGEVFAALYHRGRAQSRSQHQLSAALERFRQAAEAMPDGIIMLDEADLIEWCNPVAEAQFGLSSKRDLGQRITYLLRQAQFTEYLSAHNYRDPLILKAPRSTDVTLSIQLVPFGDKQKLLISRDITRFERVETMRRDFVANVSHELRTPLTVVAGFLEGLAEGEGAEARQDQRHFQLMLEQSRRMQRLIEDLLTLSRLESPQERRSDEVVNVPTLLEALCKEALSLSAGRHRIRLEIGSGSGLMGSESELRSAFGNLISNAIRYTPEGGEITLRWGIEGGDGVFSVQDTGIGIEPQHLPRLTERFYRVDRGRSRETGGTGLGLSIVKHVLTRHQARLEIASEPGKGSTFRACFPVQRLEKITREVS
ncbi:MAG: phosphate regulon sensor histidine kinase PhoR [Pseudomonadota bacterium]